MKQVPLTCSCGSGKFFPTMILHEKTACMKLAPCGTVYQARDFPLKRYMLLLVIRIRVTPLPTSSIRTRAPWTRPQI